MVWGSLFLRDVGKYFARAKKYNSHHQVVLPERINRWLTVVSARLAIHLHYSRLRGWLAEHIGHCPSLTLTWSYRRSGAVFTSSERRVSWRTVCYLERTTIGIILGGRQESVLGVTGMEIRCGCELASIKYSPCIKHWVSHLVCIHVWRIPKKHMGGVLSQVWKYGN